MRVGRVYKSDGMALGLNLSLAVSLAIQLWPDLTNPLPIFLSSPSPRRPSKAFVVLWGLFCPVSVCAQWTQ